MGTLSPALRTDQAAAGLEDGTRLRLLDAAFACAERYGIGKTTMSDVARASGLSRQTLYRYFESKHDLTAALVIREEERLLDQVRAAAEPYAELRPALQAAFACCLRFIRSHPLLTKVMAVEPQELLPFLTIEASPVIDLGARTIEEVLSLRLPDAGSAQLGRAAETCARILTSYAITPTREPVERLAASLAELLCNGIGSSAGAVRRSRAARNGEGAR